MHSLIREYNTEAKVMSLNLNDQVR